MNVSGKSGTRVFFYDILLSYKDIHVYSIKYNLSLEQKFP